ncbi:hypothetical protein F66182_2420 [Fusarium sp. NRRL 66182]|nr:hypothetical protein F66182_2420 [Fusarium sp. NRRL 66182]
MQFLFVFSIWTGLTTAYLAKGCKQDACVIAAIGSNISTSHDECRSFLLTTVRPAKATVNRTITITPSPTTAQNVSVPVLAKVESIVKIDNADLTTTKVMDKIATVMTATSVTVTRMAQPPFKRAYELPETTIEATKIPPSATKACTEAASYSSACSCAGVKPGITTLKGETVTSTHTTTVHPPVSSIIKANASAAEHVEVETDQVTETYSTTTITRIVDTVTVKSEGVQTVESTKTITVDAPLQTVRLVTRHSQDPNLDRGIGWASLEPFLHSRIVYYVTFSSHGSGSMFSVDPNTGKVEVYRGPGQSIREGLFYSTFDGRAPASYGMISPDPFATFQGSELAVCKIDTANDNKLVCKWGDKQIAEFWSCRGRMSFVRPGTDFAHACTGSAISYRINIFAEFV